MIRRYRRSTGILGGLLLVLLAFILVLAMPHMLFADEYSGSELSETEETLEDGELQEGVQPESVELAETIEEGARQEGEQQEVSRQEEGTSTVEGSILEEEVTADENDVTDDEPVLYAMAGVSISTRESESNNTEATANVARLNQEVRASMSGADEDWFVFSVPSEGSYTLSFASDGGVGGTFFRYSLYDDDRSWKAGDSESFDNYEANTHSVYLKAGVAHLYVRLGNSGSNNSGDYRFKLRNSSGTSSMNDGAISSSNVSISNRESEGNGSRAKANVARLNQEVRASMSGADEDWFVFSVPSEGSYTLSFASDGGVGGTFFRYSLYDDDRSWKAGDSESFDNYEANTHSVYLKAGVAHLYVRLGNSGSNNSGDYRFKLTKDIATPISIHTATISSIPDQIFTGWAITPQPTVSLGGKTLVKDRDYKLFYSNNTDVGTATIYVAGENDYTGYKSAEFKIVSPSSSSSSRTPIYRMYNRLTSEHLYTTSSTEYGKCGSGAYRDWKAEGIAWYAPTNSSTPVYRLYNPVSGDHHYTNSAGERNSLVNMYGWRSEGVAFYSAASSDGGSTAVYRVYNGKLIRGQHHYTMGLGERNNLVAYHGWKSEGVGFYGYASA